MRNYYPLLIVGGFLGLVSAIFILAYALIKDKKEAFGFERNMKDGEIVRRLLKYAKPYYKNFLLVFVLMLFSISNSIISPLLIGDIEGIIKTDFEITALFLRVGLYALVVAISLVSSYFQAMILQRTGQKIVSALRENLFLHVENLSHEQLNAMPVGKLVTRVTNDVEGISRVFTNSIVNLAKNCFILIGVVIAMFSLNYALTLVVLCFAPFIVLFTLIFRKFSRRAYRKVKDGTTDINTFLSENLSGVKVTQIFNREDKKFEEFNEKNERLGKAKSREIFVFSIFRPLVYMLYISSVLFLLFLGGKGYIDGGQFMGTVITSEVIVTFYMYLSTFFNPIQNLAEQFNWLQSAFASAEKVFSLFDMQPVITDSEGAIELENLRGDIEFKNVWFSYVPGEWVLKDLSFKVSAGQTVAFVGSTGSGKTTIMSLICRNYDIQKGEILIDGIDIKKIKIASLRKHFGQMLQDVFLFSGTVRSNICMLGDEFSDEEIMNACRYVNADGLIAKLKNGLDEEVRERGNNFSAGERQLLSFARAVIHRPEVMILDEATANIDTETERLIQDSLEKMMNIGTMLVVAHRLSTIRKADNIIVLSHGEIIEQGSHDELIAKQGRYYGLYMLQYHRDMLNA